MRKVMANKKHYDEAYCVRALSRKHSCQISMSGNQRIIEVEKDGDLGNGSWGKIDFLVHYCGYSVITVPFIHRGRKFVEDEQKVNIPKVNGFDMTSSVKNVMKGVKIIKKK